MNWNIAPEYVSLIFISILMIYSREYNLLPTLKNRLFNLCLFFVFCEIIISIVSIIALEYYRIIPIVLNHIIQILYFLSSPVIAILFMFYLISVVHESDARKPIYFAISWIPYIFYAIIVLTNPITGYLYHIGEMQGFIFGEGFILVSIFPLLYISAMFLIILLNRKKIERYLILILISFPIISMFMVVLQWIFPSIILSGTAATSALLIVYLYLQNKQVILDDLTGLQNRKTFSKMLLLNIHRKRSMDILLVSLDDFKTVNDKFGYLNGDEFLKMISQFLIQLATIKSIYRFSGDEFIIILDKNSPISVSDLVASIQNRFDEPWIFKTLKTEISTSIAVVKFPDHADTLESIIALLEYCIDLAKKSGKGKIVFSDTDKVNKLKRKNMIIERLKQGLIHDNFNVFYQPIYSIKEERLTTAEALLRFSDDEFDPISLAELIPIAEETGLIIEIGFRIVDKVCKFIKDLQDLEIEIDAISINLSAIQLMSEGFVSKFLEIIAVNQIDTSKLRMEITESVFINNAEFIHNIMLQLNEHGIQFYMDDFGTGYSNMVSIIKLPFTYIKIDKSILYESISNRKCFSVLKGFCRTFKEVGIKILIEGVENEEQEKIAKKIKADYIQGFLFARPMPDFDVLRYFRDSILKTGHIKK